MNIAPISEPKTMIPAQAATQKIRREATSRSYSGEEVRRWRRTKAAAAAGATTPKPIARAPLPGTGARLMPRTSAATSSIERMPPRLSTGSLVSLTWAGTKRQARKRARTASGRVTRKTEPQANCSSRAPESSGPSEAIAPPIADQRAIERVRASPDQSAVIRARGVGKGAEEETDEPQ